MQQVIDLEGKTHNWSLTGAIAHGKLTNKSDLHLKARALIRECFPTLHILEEVPIPLKKSEILYLDFYLPLTRKCIECHGIQHYNFVPFYHNNMMGFIRHKKRDRDKAEWCHINRIAYIELPYNESIEDWKNRIL